MDIAAFPSWQNILAQTHKEPTQGRQLIELEAAVAVARRRSFRAAAAELGLSSTALSQAIVELEARLGVRLFHRTTRSVSPTPAGEQFVAQVAPALIAIRDAADAVNQHRSTPTGVLRLNASAGAARRFLRPIVFEYLNRYPEMSVDIVTEGKLIDIVREGFDAGFRLGNKLAYAIAAGCTAVIKPSEMSATQTEVVLRALQEAGLPAGVYNVVNGRGAEVGAAIAAHTDVAKISFTGSTAVGKAIVRASADSLKRVTLELGGKSPTIILDDADLDAVIPGVIEAGFMNSGQACIAGTRVFVSESRRAGFEARLKAAIETRVKAGDPRDPSTTVGPMVS